MTTGHERWLDQLSDYLDGELEGSGLRGIEAHLATCDECRSVVEDVRDIRDRARRLEASQPSRDLWPAIASAIDASSRQASSGADIIPLPVGPRSNAPPTGLFVTVRELAAAAVVVISLSAAVTWWAGVGIVSVPGAVPSGFGPAQSAASLVADVAGPSAGVADEIIILETALEQVRGRLDPNTVRILEKNLRVIQNAIEESDRKSVV